MNTAIFTYGSLMYPAVWQTIVTQTYPAQTASLAGFQRKAIQQQTYPALIPTHQALASVVGIVYFNVSAEDCERLDRFEGEEYDREEVQLTLANGQSLLAQTYVYKPEFYHRLAQHDWSVTEFEQQGLAEFLQHYKGFKKG